MNFCLASKPCCSHLQQSKLITARCSIAALSSEMTKQLWLFSTKHISCSAFCPCTRDFTAPCSSGADCCPWGTWNYCLSSLFPNGIPFIRCCLSVSAFSAVPSLMPIFFPAYVMLGIDGSCCFQPRSVLCLTPLLFESLLEPEVALQLPWRVVLPREALPLPWPPRLSHWERCFL